MTPPELAALCQQVNLAYRRDYGTLAEGFLTTGLLRLLLVALIERGWQAPEDDS